MPSETRKMAIVANPKDPGRREGGAMDRNKNPRSRRGQGTAVCLDDRNHITTAALHDALRAACAEVGIVDRDVPADGRWHETDINGDPRGRGDGRIKLFPDGEGGIACNWKRGEILPFFADDGRKLNEAERRARERRRAESIRLAEEELACRHTEAASRAAAIWDASCPAPDDHPYLIRKHIQAHGARLYRGSLVVAGMSCDGSLILPACDGSGAIHTLQFIHPEKRDGDNKRFLLGGDCRGRYFSIDTMEGVGPLCLCEGYATGASIHEATDYSVAVTFNAGNLGPVAQALRARFPNSRLVLCADDDVAVDGNPGLTKATEAARSVGGLRAVPAFGPDRPQGLKDFDDMAVHRGLEAVAERIRSQVDAGEGRPEEDEPRSGNGAAPGDETGSASFAEGLGPEDAPGSDSQDLVALEIGELLKRDFPAKESLLSPWLRRQDLIMIYSKRGVGKTHLCLALAYAIASGGKFLKWEAPEPRRVLYIDGEMPGVAIQERLTALVDTNEKEPPEGFFRIVTPDVQTCSLPDLATVAGQSEIDSLIGDAELIVLDNLSTLMRSGVENDGESWIPMATWALAQRRKGRSVMFVHHAGKGGQQRGSSRREDLLDVVICLKHPSDYMSEQGARFEVVFEKARGLFGADVATIEAALQEGADSKTSWTWKAAEGATVDRILELKGLGMAPAEIAGELGVHRSTVYRALKGRQGGGS